MKSLVFLLLILLLTVISIVRGGMWLAMLVPILFLFRERSSSLAFAIVAFLLGVWLAVLNREPWWLSGISLWFPPTVAYAISESIGTESKSIKKVLGSAVALTLWLIIIVVK